MMFQITKAVRHLIIGCGALVGVACDGAAGGGDAKKGGDEMVDIFKDGVMQRVEISKLQKVVPAEQGRVLPGQPNADAIVGWYDGGHNFHAEKMGKKDIGTAVVNEAAQRGNVMDSKLTVIRAGKDVEEIVTAEQVATFVSNPGNLKADAIVGWYDSGHNFHAQKMGSKDIGAEVINEAAQRGVALENKISVIRAGKDAPEVITVEQVAAFASNPGNLKADAIVGWYDSGHNFHAQKMGSKDIGAEVINDAAIKGKAIDVAEKGAPVAGGQ
jgi:hypothetical protein